MKMNDISRTVLNNWPIKVFSLILALCIYTIIHFTFIAEREIEIPLDLILPAGYTAVSTVPDTVLVTLKGDDRDISSVRSEAIQAVADFSDVSADGVREAPVELVYDNSLFDIEFSISSDPSVIKVYWEAKGGQSE